MKTERKAGLIQQIVLLTSVGVSVLVTAVLGPSLPKMQQYFSELSNADYLTGLNMTIPMLVMAFFSFMAGAISDRLGRKWLFVFAATLYGVIGTMPLYLDNIYHILMSRVALGFCEAFVMLIGVAMIGDLFKGNKRDRLLALQTTVASFSAFLLNNIGGVLGEISWRAPYWTYTFGFILALGMAFFLWEPDRSPEGQTASHAANSANKNEPILQPSLIVLICLMTLIAGFLFLITPIHFGYLFGSIGVTSPAKIGPAYGVNSLGVISGTLIFGFLLVGKTRVQLQLFLGFAAMAIGFFGMSKAGSYPAMTGAGLINGIGGGILLPTVITWIMRCLPTKIRGFGLGCSQSALFLGQFFSSVLVIWIARQVGGRTDAIGIVAILSFVFAGFALASIFMRKKTAIS